MTDRQLVGCECVHNEPTETVSTSLHVAQPYWQCTCIINHCHS